MPLPSIDRHDLAACRALLRGGSRSFFAASLLLPATVRAPATALYAFCRVADDAVDLGREPAAALAQLRRRLDAAYAGQPWNTPIDRAFAATVAAHRIPRSVPLALIEGLAWDTEGRRHRDFSALLDYATRVAGTVGVMMAMVMGARDATSMARAADLGIAMQLTNIARDVGEDARAGRLYLPLDWLAEAGIEAAEMLRNPQFTPALGGVVRRLLEEAGTLYARAGTGISRLSPAYRTGLNAARLIYAAIGDEVAKAGYDSVGRRASVSGWRKIRLAAAAATMISTKPGSQAPALAASLFLLNSAEPEEVSPAPRPRGLVQLITLFERLERAQRTAGPETGKSLA